MSRLRFIILLFIIHLLGACSFFKESTQEEKKQQAALSEQKLYESIQQKLKNQLYQQAVTDLQTLESRYPFGPYAEQAQLELIYAYYMATEHEAARAAADRFITLHPNHQRVDYAYYMKGLTSYSEDQSFLSRFLPTDMSKRDPGAARESFAEFSQLLSRFPSSQYASDAKTRMVYLRNILAAYEINVAKYYMRRRAFIAAANRGRYVVENFQQSTSVPDGLTIMIDAYLRLGLTDLADDALKVLAQNYPEHPALDKNGQFINKDLLIGNERSFLNIVTFGLLDNTPAPSPLMTVK